MGEARRGRGLRRQRAHAPRRRPMSRECTTGSSCEIAPGTGLARERARGFGARARPTPPRHTPVRPCPKAVVAPCDPRGTWFSTGSRCRWSPESARARERPQRLARELERERRAHLVVLVETVVHEPASERARSRFRGARRARGARASRPRDDARLSRALVSEEDQLVLRQRRDLRDAARRGAGSRGRRRHYRSLSPAAPRRRGFGSRRARPRPFRTCGLLRSGGPVRCSKEAKKAPAPRLKSTSVEG